MPPATGFHEEQRASCVYPSIFFFNFPLEIFQAHERIENNVINTYTLHTPLRK